MFLTLILEQFFSSFGITQGQLQVGSMFLYLPPLPNGSEISKFFLMFKEQLIADGRKMERSCLVYRPFLNVLYMMKYPHIFPTVYNWQ